MKKLIDKISYILSACLFLIFVLTSIVGCGAGSGSGDPPVAEASAKPANMYDDITAMGQKIQSNGYEYDTNSIDSAFEETEACLGLQGIPGEIFIILKEPYSAFPCVPLPNGCGGLFDLDNGEPVITVTADFVRLKHEYIHYMLYYTTGNPDSNHESDAYDRCA